MNIEGAPFDALLIHGEDGYRMAQIVREWRSLFSGKTILAVLANPQPVDTISLLRAGADTVIDANKPPALAAAKTHAVLRRASSKPVARSGLSLSRSSIKARKKLSPAEEQILNTILEHQGEPASRRAVLTKLGKGSTRRNDLTLRVQIHRLNNKLINAQVKAVWKTGLLVAPREADDLSKPANSEVAAVA